MTSEERSDSSLLIVEDSPTQAEQLLYLLNKNGYQARTAQNGFEALALLAEERPLAIISDVVMPGMDGYTLCRRIKGDENLQDIPVILLTSLSEPDDVIMGLECGADYFIIKPYKEKFLLSRIQHIIANRNLNSDQRAKMGMEIFFRDRKYFINSDRLQILNLLLSTYETAIQKNQELLAATEELQLLNEQLVDNLNMLDDKNLELDRLNRELVRRTKEASKAQREALDANQTKSDFLANMSHELRTPLNSVIGFSEVLEDEMFGPLNDKQREYVSNILLSGRHLLSLINDILDLSKVEAGRMTLELGLVDLRTLLASSMTMLQEKAHKHAIQMELDIAAEDQTHLMADERKLKQILFNLLSNAVKFTPEGGTVRVSARKTEEIGLQQAELWQPEQIPPPNPHQPGLEIAVSDTGIGIESQDYLKLFQEFSQLSSPYTKKHEGTGLGLALCKRLVELHGGCIGVSSQPGKGSRFVLVIPLHQEGVKNDL
nr:ATP-binding protein [uncultured Desulfuromonas sp.]